MGVGGVLYYSDHQILQADMPRLKGQTVVYGPGIGSLQSMKKEGLHSGLKGM